MAGISIGPDEVEGYHLEVYADMVELDPSCGLPYNRKVIMINSGAGTDPETGSKHTGIMIRGLGTVADGPGSDTTRISSHGIIATSGIGYQIGQLLGGTVQASGVFATLFSSSDPNIIIAGIYARVLGNGTSKRYAIFADGDTYTQGKAIAEGFALAASGQDNPGSAATEYMRSGFNLFTNKNSTGSQVFYLPLIVGYEQLEEIEVSNWNGNEINIRPQTGNSINGYNNTQKRLRLYTPGHCCKLRADKINNTWIIVSMAGEFTAA